MLLHYDEHSRDENNDGELFVNNSMNDQCSSPGSERSTDLLGENSGIDEHYEQESEDFSDSTLDTIQKQQKTVTYQKKIYDGEREDQKHGTKI
ncbi:hypothetical protein HHI36_018490 [Cryptolaemus montrouzieri]|uniref:Uncharacterized protein n=1 Tax=Cryptolaemus montrouzieri TaxID=559131 RepID=A0ABD2P030_9CUCU